MSVSALISLLQSAIIFGTVIMFGCLGEILTEKSGNLNLGVPDIHYSGNAEVQVFRKIGKPEPRRSRNNVYRRNCKPCLRVLL